MSLRRLPPETGQIGVLTYDNPVHGVNLRANLTDLQPGEAVQMQNVIYDGGTRIRNGSRRLNSTSLGAFAVRGGHKYYYGGAIPTSKRLIAYSTNISVISDAGAETVLTTGMSSDKVTYFTTWPITDSVYIGNNTDVLRRYDGTTFVTLTPAVGWPNAIPTPRGMVCPVLDRLMCVTVNGVERTNPRVDDKWSANSGWATFRPARPGLFTTLYPHSLRGTDQIYSGALAFQANATYLITGTDFGADVSAATPSTGEDGAIRLIDANVGCSSPYAITSVPGVGIFWLTSDRNVYLLPDGQLQGRYIGDKLLSHSSVIGLESLNTAQLEKAWMTYFDRYLVLGFPTGASSFSTIQYWLDLRAMAGSQSSTVWFGPMTGQSISFAWPEVQNGEFGMFGGEGDATKGIFVYELRSPNRFTDAQGTADNNITIAFQPRYLDLGFPSRAKYVRGVNLDLLIGGGTPTVDLVDIDATLVSGVTIQAVTP